MRNFIVFCLFAFLSFAIDQGSKIYVVDILDLRNKIVMTVYPPYLNFKMGWNYGVNFGLFANHSEITRWILISIAGLASLWAMIWSFKKNDFLGSIGAGLLTGGALANGYDRLIHGAVADFLSVSCCKINNPFVFNLADIFIFIGLFGLIYVMEFKKA